MFLLAGTIGTGKSTELWRIAEARARKAEEFVVFVDLVGHFNKAVGDVEALQRVSSWEVCFLCGVALIRAAQEQLQHTWDDSLIQQLAGAWQALASDGAAPPSIDLFAAAKSMAILASTAAPAAASGVGAPAAAGAAAGIRALAELAGVGKWTLPIGKKETRKLDDQDELMKNLVDKVNLLLGNFRKWNRQVLFVIDGLDRIVSFDHAGALFLHSQMIARLDCPLVVCAPFALRNHKATSEIRGFEPVILHNAPVLDHRDPAKYGPGVAFLGEVFRRRVHDLGAEEIVPQPLLDRLAYYSGGRSRDFVRSIGMLAHRGWKEDAPMVTDAMVHDVLKEARLRVEGGIYKEDITVLEAVARDPKHELPEGTTARDLLTYGRLLPYPNESEWFYPHPLLTINKVQV